MQCKQSTSLFFLFTPRLKKKYVLRFVERIITTCHLWTGICTVVDRWNSGASMCIPWAVIAFFSLHLLWTVSVSFVSHSGQESFETHRWIMRTRRMHALFWTRNIKWKCCKGGEADFITLCLIYKSRHIISTQFSTNYRDQGGEGTFHVVFEPYQLKDENKWTSKRI